MIWWWTWIPDQSPRKARAAELWSRLWRLLRPTRPTDCTVHNWQLWKILIYICYKIWFGTFVSFLLPYQSLSYKTRVKLSWFSNYFQLELEIRLPSLERERSLLLFCLPAKALLASGGCLRTKGGLSLLLSATTLSLLQQPEEFFLQPRREGGHKATRLAARSYLSPTAEVAISCDLPSRAFECALWPLLLPRRRRFGCFGQAAEYPQADNFL